MKTLANFVLTSAYKGVRLNINNTVPFANYSTCVVVSTTDNSQISEERNDAAIELTLTEEINEVSLYKYFIHI